MNKLLTLSVLVGLLQAGVAHGELQYTYTEVVRPGYNVYASELNDARQIVGYTQTGSADARAFLYENGSFTDIPTLRADGSGESTAYSINDNGQVTGTASVDSTSSYHRSAFIWQAGVMTDLTDVVAGAASELPGYFEGDFYGSYGRRINDAGAVLLSVSGAPHVYQSGSMSYLGTWAEVIDLNASGLALIDDYAFYVVKDGPSTVFSIPVYDYELRLYGLTNSGWLYGGNAGDCNITCNPGTTALIDTTGGTSPLVKGPTRDFIVYNEITDNGWVIGRNQAGDIMVSSADHNEQQALTLAEIGIDDWSPGVLHLRINDNGDFIVTGRDGNGVQATVLATLVPDPVAIPASIEIQPEVPFTALHPHHDGNLGPLGIGSFPDDPINVVVITQSTAVGDPVDLDATDIDPTTLAFGPGGGAINPASTPDFSQDVDSDGMNDAQFEFLTSDSGIQCADVDASLSGELLTSGEAFLGTDAITTDCDAQCHN